ncbi:MAG: PA0069 family radical SAM protein [Methylococcaceae bacterium]|nr:PA0069 family radical SAM protein [Methylococcaceae bacterium]
MPNKARKGRGALSNSTGRYESLIHEAFDDGWGSADEPLEALRTTLSVDSARRVITYNRSPDVGFDRSINPYRGCEHGCVYCFARPTHTWLGLSAGLDFETRLFYKPDAPERLREELAERNYRCRPVALGINTDAYQPVERKIGLTRRILEILCEANHPVNLVTKSSLIERDLDLLSEMAGKRLVSVSVSITTLSRNLARRLEPRAAAPERRLEILHRVADAGIPAGLLLAPLIPVLTDGEMENILKAARAAGASSAGYVLLRLPHEISGLFSEWLETHEPLKADHVMSRIRETRGGKNYDSRFGIRMRGTGDYAELLAQRFRLAVKKLGFGKSPALNTGDFRPPVLGPRQMSLF